MEAALAWLEPLDARLQGAVERDRPPDVTLRILRGSQERTFTGDLAKMLLSWEMVDGASASQLSSLALLADNLAGLEADPKYVRSSLLLEVDARTAMMRISPVATVRLRELAGQVPDELSASQFACFLREIAASRRRTED